MQRSVWQNTRIVIPLLLAQTAVYLSLNHCELFPSRAMPETWLDRALPFALWTIWPYAGLLVCELVLSVLVRDALSFRRMLAACIGAMTLSYACFLLYPTHQPRPPRPPCDSLTALVYHLLVTIDSPRCAFPSGHVIVPVTCAWFFWRDRGRLGAAVFAAVVLSTLAIITTRQHSGWDLVGGYVLATLGIVAATRWVRPGSSSRELR